MLRHPGDRRWLRSPASSETGKKIHYDTLRASVITGVSASVIAFASGRGLPVSTTYVAFAAVLGTGLSDRVFSRGDADLKIGPGDLGHFLLVPLPGFGDGRPPACWRRSIFHLSIFGLVLCIAMNLTVRAFFSRRPTPTKYATTSGRPRKPSDLPPRPNPAWRRPRIRASSPDHDSPFVVTAFMRRFRHPNGLNAMNREMYYERYGSIR